MVGRCARGLIQKYAAATISCVQWMATGQSGGFGKSVQRAVDKVTGPEPESAVIHQLSTVGSHVMVALWIQSCVILGLAQLMVSGVLGCHGVLAVRLVGKVLRHD